MTPSLLAQLYTKRECCAIKDLYNEDDNTNHVITEAIGTKLITHNKKIVTTNLLDALFLICLTAKFAFSEDECFRVASSVHQFHNKPLDISPSIAVDRGLTLANKILISLSFHSKLLERRWKQRGAPSPSYYRATSKTIFSNYKQADISEHHEHWEKFLGEMLV